MATYNVTVNSNLNNYNIVVNPTGGAGAPRTVDDIFILGGNQTIFNLTNTPLNSTNVGFYVNGLKQLNSTFNLSVNTITVTGFTPTVGDTVVFSYFY